MVVLRTQRSRGHAAQGLMGLIGLSGCLILALSSISARGAAPSAAASSAASLPVLIPAPSLEPAAGPPASSAVSSAPTFVDDLQQMRALQQRVQKVSTRAKEATVHVRISMRRFLSQGSGVIVSEDGLVLTAAHVIGEADKDCTLTLHDGRRLKGRSLGLNHDLDCGMIRIVDEDRDFRFAPVGDERELDLGDWCIAFGHPGGLERDRAPVLRLGRLQQTRMPPFLRTDCAIISGDSGGPLFNLDGEVIGIHSRIQARVSSNYHVGASTFTRHWRHLEAGTEWRLGQARLGVKGEDASPGVRLTEVAPGAAAEAAGLEVGDVVLNFGDEDLRGWRDLTGCIQQCVPGDQVVVMVQRGAQRQNLLVTMGSVD